MLYQNIHLKHFKTWLPFLLAIVTMALTYSLYGFYLEDAERFGASVLYGGICAPPVSDNWFFDPWLFHVPILARLSTAFESVPVLGVWHIITQLLYLTLWFHLALRVLNRDGKGNLLIVIPISCLLVAALMGTSLVYFYNLRDAILLSTASLLLYFDYNQHDGRKPVHFLFIFLLACLLRLPGALLALTSITVLFFLYYRNLKTLFRLLKFHWLMVIALALLVKGHEVVMNNPGMKIEQGYEYALTDRGAVLPVSVMKTREDTMRYRALTEYFLISDSAQINIGFIARVVDNNKYLSLGITQSDFAHLLKKSLPVIKKYKEVILLFYLLLLIAGYNRSGTIFTVILFNLFCWLIVLVIGMKLSMYNYFLAPWLAITFGASLYFLSTQKPFNLIQKTGVVIVLTILLGYETKGCQEISYQETDYNKMAFTYLKKLDTLSEQATPVLWDFEELYLPTKLFSRKESSVLKKCIFQNMFFLNYYRFGQERALQKFGFSPLDWRSMNLGFKQNNDKICFVLDDRFASFLGQYYNTIYGLDFKLVKDIPEKEIYPGIFVYRLDSQ